jgi:hypothetical protein
VVSRQALGLLALASSVSACTLIDPHSTTLSSQERNEIILAAQSCPEMDPTTGRVDLKKLPEGTTELSPYCQFYGQLPAVIAYAYAQSEEFDGAVSSQSVLKNGIALGVIPAAAAGLFLGIQGGHTEALLALASGSAAALGLGSFLSSEPRQAVYSSGSLALGCSILKASPYLLDRDQYRAIGTDFTAVQGRLENSIVKADDLANQLDAQDAKIIAVEASIRTLDPNHAATADSSEIRQSAASSIKVARQAITDASTLTPKVLAARMKIDQASVTLEQAVHSIAEQVSREVTKTEPDINTIRALASQIAPGVQAQIAGIAAVQKALAPEVPTETKSGAGPTPLATAIENLKVMRAAPELTADQLAQLTRWREELKGLVTKQWQLTTALQATLDSINADADSLRQSIVLVQPLIESLAAREAKAAAVPACVVEAAQVGFTISPPVTEQAMKVGETKGIIVNGAVGTATGTVIDGKPNGIVFETKGNGTGLVVNMTAKVPGNYVVAISDNTGKGTKTINVAVATGLTLKSGDKVVEDTVEVAKGSDTKIDIAGGNGALATLVPGSQIELTVSAPTGDSTKGSVTINAKGAGPYNLTIKAGEEQRNITITVKK